MFRNSNIFFVNIPRFESCALLSLLWLILVWSLLCHILGHAACFMIWFDWSNFCSSFYYKVVPIRMMIISQSFRPRILFSRFFWHLTFYREIRYCSDGFSFMYDLRYVCCCCFVLQVAAYFHYLCIFKGRFVVKIFFSGLVELMLIFCVVLGMGEPFPIWGKFPFMILLNIWSMLLT